MAALFDYEENREAASAAKVRALEALLIKKGVLGSDSVDAVLAISKPWLVRLTVPGSWRERGLTQPTNVACWRIRRRPLLNFNFQA